MSQLWERQPIADAPLSVIVLTERVDAEALRQTLKELHNVLPTLNRTTEVLVPCQATAQATLQPALEACPHSRLISCDDAAFAQGTALKAGIAAATHPLLFVLPIGYSPTDLPRFLKEIDLVDIACGTRKSKERGWKWRQFRSSAYQLFGLWLQDPECPMRLYRKEIFKNLPIQSLGSFAQIEILAKANFQSKLLSEVPIDGPSSDSPHVSRDFWRVLQNPDFGPPPEKMVETAAKPLFTSQAPEARV